MRLHVHLSDGLVERVDAVRGDVPRSKFIQRALEYWTAPDVVRNVRTGEEVPVTTTPAPPRAPDANYGALKRAPYVKPFNPQHKGKR